MSAHSIPFRTVAILPSQLPAKETEISTKVLLALLLGHVAVGMLVEISPVFDYIHMYLALGLGFGWVVFSKNQPERAAYVAAYFAASEVLWRMDFVSVFWEIGKYGCAAVMLIALAKMQYRKAHAFSATYFMLLLPAAAIAYWVLGFDVGRQRISFALSGPFALMVAVWYFSNLKLTTAQMRNIFLTLACGAMATGGATAYAMLSAKNLHFSNNSSMEASGGFGPNQVSAVLGVGVLFLVLYVVQGSAKLALHKVILLSAAVFMAALSALTFSRGGLVDDALSFVLAAIILARDNQYRSRLIPALVAGVLASMLVLPRLEDLTGGALGKRFENTSTTHRSELIMAELDVWSENPIFGSGVSLASEARQKASHSSKVAHTEFSRILAEHGVFGLIAGLLLFAMPIMRWREVQGVLPKALIVMCCTWAFAYMASNAMRLAAPSFLYGLAFVTLVPAGSLFVLKAQNGRSVGLNRF